jgi:threonine dehydrogenase-like Zn-dependent dehydrogenase
VTGAIAKAGSMAPCRTRRTAAEWSSPNPDPGRLATASTLGLEVVDEQEVALCREAKLRWVHGPGDCGADLVLQCRGRALVLHEARRALRPQGTVIDPAFYQGGAQDLRLGEEFHHDGLTIRCGQIARVPHALSSTWDSPRLGDETTALLAKRAGAPRAHGHAHHSG